MEGRSWLDRGWKIHDRYAFWRLRRCPCRRTRCGSRCWEGSAQSAGRPYVGQMKTRERASCEIRHCLDWERHCSEIHYCLDWERCCPGIRRCLDWERCCPGIRHYRDWGWYCREIHHSQNSDRRCFEIHCYRDWEMSPGIRPLTAPNCEILPEDRGSFEDLNSRGRRLHIAEKARGSDTALPAGGRNRATMRWIHGNY